MSNMVCKEIARRFVSEILNKGNPDSIDALITRDFVYHSAAEDLFGIENFKRCMASDHVTFQDITYTFVDSVTEDDKVVVIWIVEGIHVKEFRGIPATHKKFEIVGCNILHLEDCKIREAWSVADGLSAALQLGVVNTEFM